MKRKLIELLKSTGMVESESRCEIIAEELLAEGVIVPPCKVGDEIRGEIVHTIDYRVFESQGCVRDEAFVHTMKKEDRNSVIFCSHPITWEEAEKELFERSKR